MWTNAHRQSQPPFTCAAQHNAGGARRRAADLTPDYMRACLPAAPTLGRLCTFQYTFILFTGLLFMPFYVHRATRAAHGHIKRGRLNNTD